MVGNRIIICGYEFTFTNTLDKKFSFRFGGSKFIL